MPTAIKIVQEYLEANGFDGLYTDDCGCKNGNLAPCASDFSACKPGYSNPMTKYGVEFANIGPNKPEKEQPVTTAVKLPLSVVDFERIITNQGSTSCTTQAT